MTDEEINRAVLEALAKAVPGEELGNLDPQQSFRDQLDIDSIDFLNFITALHGRLGVDIPDVDATRLSSLQGCLDYLRERAPRLTG